MKCSFCSKKAIYYAKYNQNFYCKRHFEDFIKEKVLKTIQRFKLARKGEKIGISLSGGKDSTTCLLILKEIGRYKIKGLNLEEGIGKYEEYLKKFIKEIERREGIDVARISFREFFGKTLDEMVAIAKKKKLPYSACSICGVLRRYLINFLAKKERVNKIATGHTLNDEVQTFFMDLSSNNIKPLTRLGPRTGVWRIRGFVQRIKPLFFVYEKESTTYILSKGYRPPLNLCPYAPLGYRWKIRLALYKYEEKNPGFHLKIGEFIARFQRKFRKKPKIRKCEICGQPTNREICKACEILARLGIY